MMKTEDYFFIGVGIAGLAGIAYALRRNGDNGGPPPQKYIWCATENRNIPEGEWTSARCEDTPPPPPQPEWVEEGEILPVNITEPYDGDYWWKYFGLRLIGVEVTNPYSVPKNFWIYVSVFSFNSANQYEYDEYTQVTLEPNETQTVKHLELDVSGWMDDEYHVFAAVRRSQEAVNYGVDMHRVIIGTSPLRLF